MATEHTTQEDIALIKRMLRKGRRADALLCTYAFLGELASQRTVTEVFSLAALQVGVKEVSPEECHELTRELLDRGLIALTSN